MQVHFLWARKQVELTKMLLMYQTNVLLRSLCSGPLIYQHFYKLFMAEISTTVSSYQKSYKITNLPKTREKVTSTKYASNSSPPCLTMHRDWKTNISSLNMWKESHWLQIGFHIMRLGFESYIPFMRTVYFDCYLSTHLLTLYNSYFPQLFHQLNAIQCGDCSWDRSQHYLAEGTVCWILGLFSPAMFACWTAPHRARVSQLR